MILILRQSGSGSSAVLGGRWNSHASHKLPRDVSSLFSTHFAEENAEQFIT
ncbi:MAG: hypothetical protein VW492_00325 [Deltaproteobacteria bacterium]|nr:hypothetical protein [SAR324 cluster bacterium]